MRGDQIPPTAIKFGRLPCKIVEQVQPGVSRAGRPHHFVTSQRYAMHRPAGQCPAKRGTPRIHQEQRIATRSAATRDQAGSPFRTPLCIADQSHVSQSFSRIIFLAKRRGASRRRAPNGSAMLSFARITILTEPAVALRRVAYRRPAGRSPAEHPDAEQVTDHHFSKRPGLGRAR